jgi:hypothetical protein
MSSASSDSFSAKDPDWSSALIQMQHQIAIAEEENRRLRLELEAYEKIWEEFVELRHRLEIMEADWYLSVETHTDDVVATTGQNSMAKLYKDILTQCRPTSSDFATPNA